MNETNIFFKSFFLPAINDSRFFNQKIINILSSLEVVVQNMKCAKICANSKWITLTLKLVAIFNEIPRTKKKTS